MGLFQQLLSPDFMPHGYCYLWDARMVWLHVVSDGLIALSYYCIPVVLIYFIRKNRDIPFNRIFWMFGIFILACGTTHLMEIWNVWHSSYLLAGVLKAITAVVSVVTAAMLIPLVPKVISLPGRMHLQEANRKLAEEIAARKRFDTPIDAPLRRRVTVGFIVAVLLTLFIGFSSWRGARLAEQDAYWVSHTHDVLETIQLTNRNVIEAETSARAFALTGQEPLLLHYQSARDSTYRDEDALRHLTADNLSQQRRLGVLGQQVGTALEFAENIIAKRRKLRAYPGSSDALETERLLDLVRATTRDMYDEESRLLNQRTQKAQAGQRLARIIAIAGAFFAVGLWSLARFAVNREIDVSERARTQVSTLNAELEQRVEQRTAALQSEIAERKRAERANETVLRELADQKFALDQHAIVAVTDVQGTITYVNDKFCTISKYSKEELIGQNHRILNSRHHSKEFFQQMYQTIANGNVWHGEIKNRAKDGSIYWVDTTIVPTLSTEGKPHQYVAIRADITERKQAEEAVKESLATSKAALKDLADQKFALDQHAIVAITDVQGTITYVNDKFCAISKYSKAELIGQNHRILNSGHHPVEFFQQMYQTIAKGKVWHGEIKNRAKDGSIYWVDTTIVPFVGEDGKPRQYVAIRADISERKRTEEGRERLAAVVEASDDAIIGKTLEGTITAWNRGAEKVFGYSAAEAVGQSMLMLFPPERVDDESDILTRIRRGESVEHFETVRVRKGGTKIDVSATISPIKDSNGVIVGASTIARDITEHKRSEEALHQSDARRRIALETAKLGDWELDLTTLHATRSFLHDEIFGYHSPLPEWTFDIFLDHVHPDDRETVRENFQKSVSQSKRWEFACRIVWRDGNIRWIWSCGDQYRDLSGDATHMFGVVADITERKQAEQALQQSLATSEAALKELADQKFALDQHAIVAVTDVQGTITYVNDKFCAISQYSRAELVGQNHRILNSGHHPVEFFEQMYHSIAKGKVWHGEIKNRAKGGSIYWVDTTIVPFLGAGGKPRQYVAIRADITERKLAGEALAAQALESSRQAEELARSRQALDAQTLTLQYEARYRSLLEAAPDAMVVVNEGGEIVRFNVQAEKQFGYRGDELVGQKVNKFIPGGFAEGLIADGTGNAANELAAHIGAEIELCGRRKDGSEFPIEIKLSPLESPEGILVTAAIRDISVLKQSEEELVKTVGELKRSNAELQQFAYVSSHDLQEPLRMVASYTQLLASRYKGRLDSDADEFIAFAVDGCNRMQVLIEDLLTYSRAGAKATTLRKTATGNALQEALTNLRARIEENGAVVTHDSLPAITTDAKQLAQVFQNLVGNAIKYRGVGAPAIHVSASQNGGNEWIFSVRDNGLGIDPQYFERIFILFQRLHGREEFEGTGIGLAICKKIVERMGGRIWVESQPGKGSTFYFALPEREGK
jgi:PAS domain S-box-containing protein